MRALTAVLAAALILPVTSHAAGANLMIRSVIGGDIFCMNVGRDIKQNGTPVFMFRCHGREN
jgi:hypothetical protein